jgi:hypothetical protein
LLTLLGDLGPWRERIYLAGGLVPRYLVGQLPEGARAHIGTTDIDLVIGLALGDETPETYRTLQSNLEKAHFEQREPSFRWARDVDGGAVLVEFLCETDKVEPGRIYRPKGESTGSKLGAFNVRGAHLTRDDFIERVIEGERLDAGGQSRVVVRVANVLPYTVLKVFAFQDRHENKDAYDLASPSGTTRVARELWDGQRVNSRPWLRAFDRSPDVGTATSRFVTSGRSCGLAGGCRTMLRTVCRHRGLGRGGSRSGCHEWFG